MHGAVHVPVVWHSMLHSTGPTWSKPKIVKKKNSDGKPGTPEQAEQINSYVRLLE